MKYQVIKTRIEGYKKETFESYFRFVNKWSPSEKWRKYQYSYVPQMCQRNHHAEMTSVGNI